MKVSAYDDFILKEGDILFKEGEPAKFVYLIKTGEVISVKENDGRLFPVGFFASGDFVGTANTISDGSFEESVIARSKCIVTPLPVSDIDKVMQACPDWVGDVLTTVSSRLNGSLDLITEHKINLDSSQLGADFTDEDEATYRKVLNA